MAGYRLAHLVRSMEHNGWEILDYEEGHKKEMSTYTGLVCSRLPKHSLPESNRAQLHSKISEVIAVKDLVDMICAYMAVQITPNHIKFEDFITRFAASIDLSDALQFPPPKGININMMPFHPKQIDSLPPEYHAYWRMIHKCVMLSRNCEEVWYLTIHESEVQPGGCQRRPGLHTELPCEYQQDSEMTLERRSGW